MSATETQPSVERLLAKVLAERDRARSLAAHLEQLCAEREELLRLAVEPHSSGIVEHGVRLAIRQHLIDTGSAT